MTRAKVSLKPWQPYRVWRNHAKGEQARTIIVYPCVEMFPAGCAITVFEAPDSHTGGPQNGAVPIGAKGDAVALTVQPGNTVFVHFDNGKTNVISVLADISQEP
jgi:hypothetical protein